MSVVEKMRNETQYLITLVKQLTPFIHNYKAVSDKLHPKLGNSSSVGPDGQSLDNMNQVRHIITRRVITRPVIARRVITRRIIARRVITRSAL